MTTSGANTVRERAFGESLLLAALAALLYALTWQQALHGTDWRWFVLWLDEPGVAHPQHPGYLVVARGFWWLLSPWGFDAFGVLRVLSVLGGAVAVLGCHRAALAIAGDRTFARTVALLAMLTPALWHFATVVELHAPFAAVMAFALGAAVHWARNGTWSAAAWTGVLTGLATLMHATGHLLVLVVGMAIVWACRSRGFRWLLGRGSVFAVAHGVTWSALFAVIRATGRLPEEVVGFAARPNDLGAPDHPLAYLLRWFRDMDFAAQFLPTVGNEWLLAFAPVSVLVLLALCTRRWHTAAAMLLAVLSVYLVATVALVHAWTDERGAYLLPLLLPAVVLSLAALPRRLWPVLLLATLVCGWLFRGEPGRLPPDSQFGAAAVAMQQAQKTVFFVADFPEMDGAFRANPRLDLLLARKEFDDLRALQQQNGSFVPTSPQIVGWLGLLRLQAKEKGAQLVVTDRATAWLSQRVPAFAEAWPAFVGQVGAERLAQESGIQGVVVR